MFPEEIDLYMSEIGQPRFRAGQIFSWLHKGVRDFDLMSNIPVSLRERLKGDFALHKPVVLSKEVSKLDGTIKYLWELQDGNAVEAVIMRYSYGNTICVSTQVGCRQGCAFCASTIGGLVRCLTAGEILDEVIYSQLDSGLKISHIVLMGIGEPLDNYDNVIRFIKLVNHKNGLNIGIRNITLSTCGIIEKFDALAAENLPFTVAVSLHAASDELRSRIMPSNRGRGLDKLVEACIKYNSSTGRRISFEYAMIRDVNDTDEDAYRLSEIANRVHAHINLIPLNEVEEKSFRPSTPERLKSFISILEKNNVNVTVRRKLGGDLNASCGQLRRKFTKEKQ